MGATSVTGVGLGSADGSNMGSEHMTLGVTKLIGPRVVAAGTGTLSGGALTVILPVLPGATADYVVMVTDTNASATAVSGSIAVSASATTITLAGTTTHVLAYAVIKVGLSV